MAIKGLSHIILIIQIIEVDVQQNSIKLYVMECRNTKVLSTIIFVGICNKNK